MIVRKGYLRQNKFLDEDTGEFIKLKSNIQLNVRCYIQLDNTKERIHRLLVLEYYPIVCGLKGEGYWWEDKVHWSNG